MAIGNVTAIERGVLMLSLCDGAINKYRMSNFPMEFMYSHRHTECYNKTIELVNISDEGGSWGCR